MKANISAKQNKCNELYCSCVSTFQLQHLIIQVSRWIELSLHSHCIVTTSSEWVCVCACVSMCVCVHVLTIVSTILVLLFLRIFTVWKTSTIFCCWIISLMLQMAQNVPERPPPVLYRRKTRRGRNGGQYNTFSMETIETCFYSMRVA